MVLILAALIIPVDQIRKRIRDRIMEAIEAKGAKATEKECCVAKNMGKLKLLEGS